MSDVLGDAIKDYYHQAMKGKLWIHNKYGKKEEMPVDTYFRDEDNMSDLELFALQRCKGTVLDIGAGAGSISLQLQQKNIEVTAIEISPNAVSVMKLRGVKKVVQEDIFQFEGAKFHTLLLLMNGIGLTGNINTLRLFLQHAKKLLHPGGQLLFDSSDVAYLYRKETAKPKHYYGEIMYQYEYKKQKSEWFSWLYIDQHLLKTIAAEEGWNCDVLFEDEYDQYLARLVVC
jgi:2-polyprenyl-3-methyl-5-hydroxy-6-metoxy-1,4-benzoquinol methylase